MTGGRGSLPTQCRSKPGYGPDAIYCKVHAMEHFPEPVATWYKASTGFTYEIVPVAVTAFSDKTVTVMTGSKASRVNRKGDYGYYFPTFEEAKEWLLSNIRSKLKRAESDAAEYRKALEKVGEFTP